MTEYILHLTYKESGLCHSGKKIHNNETSNDHAVIQTRLTIVQFQPISSDKCIRETVHI